MAVHFEEWESLMLNLDCANERKGLTIHPTKSNHYLPRYFVCLQVLHPPQLRIIGSCGKSGGVPIPGQFGYDQLRFQSGGLTLN